MPQGDAIDSQALLTHHARRHCSPQWRAFLPLLFTELYRNASQADADAFLRHLGGQLAGELPLEEQATLEALERAINRRWDEIDWGYVRLGSDATGIVIHHAACPTPAGPTPESDASSRRAMAALLEGCYGQWLQGQGGATSVPIHTLPAAAAPAEDLPGCVSLRYGHVNPLASPSL